MKVEIRPYFITQNSDDDGDIYVFGVGCMNLFQFGIRSSSYEEATFLLTQPDVLAGIKSEIVNRIAFESANYLGIYTT